MRFWFDTEFIEDGQMICPLSIGIVADDGREYYAEFAETDRSRAGDWVRKNVIPRLNGSTKSASVIRSEILEFAGQTPEFWAYFAAYDWVILCQLFGSMMDLPETWPKYCLDVKQIVHMLGNPSLQRPDGGDHNALQDARWIKKIHLEMVK